MRKREGMEKGRMRNVKSQLHSERERERRKLIVRKGGKREN